mmetsp:Transcript_96765/g.270862  ORF Transcript_96765/g.270862 Transcript_96765/m.270862 type:complete len:184 (-) Transcript_96765:234-785(-)
MTEGTGSSGESKPPGGSGPPKGQQRFNRGGRGGGRRNNISRQNAIQQPKFHGKCEDLKGHVFECDSIKQADNFNKTVKEISQYVGRSFKDGGTMSRAINGLEMPALIPPTDPPDNASLFEQKYFDNKVKEYIMLESLMKTNNEKLYHLVIGQCTLAMEAKLAGDNGFETIQESMDGIGLLHHS